MKRKVIFLVLAVLAIVLILFCACTKSKSEKISDECLRIHIRANSNSEGDQAVKLKVRDNLTSYLTELLKDCKSKSDAAAVIEGSRGEICDIANNTLLSCGFSYSASVEIRREDFPERNYDGLIFPEGTYDALIVGLGESMGENWWCVAFPPLCFVPNGNGENVVYKSWVKEILDKIFS